ncbi:MAG: hypothetical protein L6V83_03760 [Christensenella sp.]|nr:MAG: hypothetical protein L6V83_03760 [Christensenella sp.]
MKKVVEKSLTYGENMVSFETYFFAEARKNTTGKPNIKTYKKAFFLLAVAIAKKNAFFCFLSKKRA